MEKLERHDRDEHIVRLTGQELNLLQRAKEVLENPPPCADCRVRREVAIKAEIELARVLDKIRTL